MPKKANCKTVKTALAFFKTVLIPAINKLIPKTESKPINNR